MAYNVSSGYKETIYSQDDENQLKLLFNNVELQDADEYCEEISITSRVLANDGNNVFSIDSFISKEVQVILHDIPDNTITEPVSIQIGTLVNNSYEYVPIGVFNIQEEPINENGKITLKLRDNRVKFDFNYDASPLIEQGGGTTTKGAILADICSKAGITTNVTTFQYSTDEIGIFDNTITATQYVAYLAEQAGCIAIINRSGELDFIDLTDTQNRTTWRIPLSILGDYQLGKPYTIKRVVFESGIAKYESSNDETLETLYLNANNPYIDRQAQVTYIYNKFNNFTLDSVTINTVLGNPAIDPYDFIQVYDDEDEDEPVLFTTLANNVYTYNGVHRQNFDTQISESKRTENVTLTGEATFQRYAKTQIDNINATITLTVGEVSDLSNTVGDLEDSISYFQVDLSQYNFTIATDSDKKPYTGSNYQSYYYAYFKGTRVYPTVSISGSNTGITATSDSSKLTFATTTGTAITNTNNEYTITFTYQSGATYTTTKKVNLALAIAGQEGQSGGEGRGISSVDYYYKATSTQEAPSASSITSTTIPTLDSTNNKYLWQKEVITYTSGNPKTTVALIAVYGDNGQQGSAGADGSQIWTTTTAPTTPNYTFTKSNLSGQSGETPKVGDVILYSYYRYTISSVSTSTVLAGTRTSLRGATGASSKWYSGTGITGTSTTATIFPNSGVSSAVVGDMYLNTDTSNTYRCTTAGNASTAKWVYSSNIQGETGSQGVSISNITEYYAVSNTSSVAPADADFSTSVQTMTSTNRYLWNYELITYSNNTTSRTAKRVIGAYGEQGQQGQQGNTGVGISSVVNKYLAYASASGVTKSTSGWTNNIQTITSSLRYLWNYEIITYTNNTTYESNPCIIGVYGEQGIQGETGDDGNGIQSITYYYATSTTQTAPSASSITSTSIPTMSETNKYLWQKQVIKYTKSGVADKVTVALIGVYGDKGNDGATSYFYIRYSANSDGNPMTTTPQDDTKYMGTATTFSNTAPTSYTEYTWSKIQLDYPDLVDHANGTNIHIDDASINPMQNWKILGDTHQDTPILPSGYTQVEYIQSSGTQYINTGYIPTINDSIETKFLTEASTSDTNLYGSRYPDFTIWINTSTNKGIAVHYPYSESSTRDTGWVYKEDIITNPVKLAITPKYIYVNDELKYTFTDTRTSYTGTLNAYLFAKNQNGYVNAAGKFKIYYFKIWSGDNLVRYFIPCSRDSDSAIGMYDVVNNVFYPNSGTGTFTKGSNVTPPTPDFKLDVKNVTGDNTIMITGLNKLKKQGYSTPLTDTDFWEATPKTTPLEDGWAKVSATNSTSSSTWINHFTAKGSIDYKNNTNYTVIFEWRNASGYTSCNISQASTARNPFTSDASPTITQTSGKLVKLLKTREVLPSDYLGLRVFFTLPANTTGNIEIRAMIIEGDYTNQNVQYEEYREQKMPLNLGVENLFNTQELITNWRTNVIAQSNNELTLKPTANGSGYVRFNIPVKAKTKYTFSCNKKITDSSGNFNGQIAIYIYNGTQENNIETLTSTTSCTFTTLNDTTSIRIYFYSLVTANSNYENIEANYSSIQLEKGDKISSYIPYGTTPIELCKIGNYQDYIYKQDGKFYKHKEIFKYVFTGSENWNNSYGTNLFNIQGAFNSKHFVVGYGLSNYYSYNSVQSNINANTSNGEFVLQKSGTTYSVFIKNTNISTVDDFKNWLITNETILYFPLETPIEEEITDSNIVQQLRAIDNAYLYSGVNNIYTTSLNDLPIILDFDYYTLYKGTQGLNSYLHVKWSEDGETFSVDSNGVANGEVPAKWQGTYVDNNPVDSTNFDDYEWVDTSVFVEGELQQLEDSINNVDTTLTNKLNETNQQVETNKQNLATITTQVTTLNQEKDNINIQIQSIRDNGVTKVVTGTGFRFDENGLDIEKTGENLHNTLDNTGMFVKRKDGSTEVEVLGADQTGVRAENVTVRNWLIIGSNSRMEDFEDGTGVFYIGGAS